MKKIIKILLLIQLSFCTAAEYMITKDTSDFGKIETYENGLVKKYNAENLDIAVDAKVVNDSIYNLEVHAKKKKTETKSMILIKKLNDSTYELTKDGKNTALKVKYSQNFTEFEYGDEKMCLGSSVFNYSKNGINRHFYKDGAIYCGDSKYWGGQDFFLHMFRLESKDDNYHVSYYECDDDRAGGYYYYLNDFSFECAGKGVPELIRFINVYICRDYVSMGALAFYFILDRAEISKFKTVTLSYNSDSELVEKNIRYAAENLASTDGLPWASAKGKGIGDKIEIEVAGNKTSTLEFYNGFQSKDKSLYLKNSRAKRIKVTNTSTKATKDFVLKDTPDKQILDLSGIIRITSESFYKATRYNIIEIEILDVYPGKKYDDLCIQAILTE